MVCRGLVLIYVFVLFILNVDVFKIVNNRVILADHDKLGTLHLSTLFSSINWVLGFILILILFWFRLELNLRDRLILFMNFLLKHRFIEFEGTIFFKGLFLVRVQNAYQRTVIWIMRFERLFWIDGRKFWFAQGFRQLYRW